VSFSLDPRLAADMIELGDLKLSRLLLMNDARYLWLVLVPRHENLSELIDLDCARSRILMEEIAAVSKALIGLPGIDKINVGAIGNIVRQLHIHIVARASATRHGLARYGAAASRCDMTRRRRARSCATLRSG